MAVESQNARNVEHADDSWELRLHSARISLLGWTLLSAVAPVLIALIVALLAKSSCGTLVWFSLVIPLCGGVIGLLLGFLYATVGRETTKFGPALTAIGSALSGAGAVELIRPEGTLRIFFSTLAANVGMADQTVLIGLVLVAFATAGFLWMYVLKTLLLNSAILKAQREEDGYNEAVQQINSPKAQRAVDPTNTADVPVDIVAAAKKITDIAKRTDVPSLRERGKAQFLQRKYTEAIATMQEVLAHVPNDRTALLYLGSSLLNLDDRELDAIPYLERLVQDPSASPEARKLLGYALLFVEDLTSRRVALGRSLHLTDEYLMLFPDDAGALLNRACALSQMAEMDESLLPKVWQSVEAAVQAGGDPVRQRLLGELSRPGMDFGRWANRPEFRSAVETSTATSQP